MSKTSFPTTRVTHDTSLREVKALRRFAGVRVTLALMLREMSTSYGKSPGGYLWAVLEPVAAITLLTMIFSLGFKSPRIGVNFPIFYATGIVPFFVFLDVSGKIATALNYSRSLLSYPSITFIDAIVGRFIINMMTQLMVAYFILLGILLAYDTRTAPELPTILLAFSMVAALAFGVGVFNCFMFTMFPIWQRVWTILTRPLILLSGVIFIYDSIPEPYAWYLWFNPLIHVVGIMRSGFYFNYRAEYASPVYVFGVSLVLTLLGIVFLYRYHRELMNR